MKNTQAWINGYCMIGAVIIHSRAFQYRVSDTMQRFHTAARKSGRDIPTSKISKKHIQLFRGCLKM